MITIFEDFEGINFFKQELIPGNMYIFNNKTPVLYLGNINGAYPILCLIIDLELRKNFNKFSFIEWNHFAELKPFDVDFIDYIIDNNIVNIIISSFKRPIFSSGGSKDSLKLIKQLEKELLKNPEIQMKIDAKNFNL